MADWFERLTGFREADYASTKARLAVEGRFLLAPNGTRHGIGELELVSLGELRRRVAGLGASQGRGGLRAAVVVGDAAVLHRAKGHDRALFQVASQFNLLEMTDPSRTPEDGVTGYQDDRTQGPACAIAAGAATIYRNYFVPLGGGEGQTRTRQLDALADLGEALGRALGRPAGALWTMRNGYALCNEAGLVAIRDHLSSLDEEQRDALRALLHIGAHRDVVVTTAPGGDGQIVSQAFCSALPIAYCQVQTPALWQAFATLVLEAAYEATLCEAVLNAARGGRNLVFLTLLGGGAFRNDRRWIFAALRRALDLTAAFDLEVRVVCHHRAEPDLVSLLAGFA